MLNKPCRNQNTARQFCILIADAMTSVAQNSDEHIQDISKIRESTLVSCGLLAQQLHVSVLESLIVMQLKLEQEKITCSARVQVNCWELSYHARSLYLISGSSMRLTYYWFQIMF